MAEAQIPLALASDHAGFRYKKAIKEHLQNRGYVVRDFGTDSEDAVDYPLFIRPAAEAVAKGECSCGIVLGGSGNGEAMAANKVNGIRCAVVWSEETATWAKEHNKANMISIGQRTVPLETALALVDTWLTAQFQGGRHQRRIDQLEPESGG
ncbi:MAG: RpiB/LacA/LacB family sugar-phosphate isomerase [Desulfovibrionales bacterium]